MTRPNRFLIGLCVALLLLNGWLIFERIHTPAQAQDTDEAEEPELAEYMGSMQQYSHKLMLSVEARNAAAAGFYLHELEELSETIENEVPTYEGHPIGSLIGSMMEPQLTELDEALDQGQWERVDTRIQHLTQACNQCHQATEHGFIQITAEDLSNPYNQSFQPAEE